MLSLYLANHYNINDDDRSLRDIEIWASATFARTSCDDYKIVGKNGNFSHWNQGVILLDVDTSFTSLYNNYEIVYVPHLHKIRKYCCNVIHMYVNGAQPHSHTHTLSSIAIKFYKITLHLIWLCLFSIAPTGMKHFVVACYLADLCMWDGYHLDLLMR